MASTARHIVFPSPKDYLDLENDGEWRHEYVGGVIYAMAGGSEEHNLIVGNIVANFKLALPEHCRTFSLDMKVHINRTPDERYYYPDVFVTCSPTDSNRHSKSEPILVVEVLSPNTARVDRGEKLEAYKALPSLMEYALVAQDEPFLEIYRRRNEWKREEITPDAPIVFESINQTLTFAQVYRQVRLAQP